MGILKILENKREKWSVSDLKKKIVSFMSKHNVMSLSTLSVEGFPCSASVFYVNDELVLYFVSKHSSLHSCNISRNPQVAITINKDYKSWLDIKGLQLLGKASRIYPPESSHALTLYLKKYPNVRSLMDSIRDSKMFGFYKVTPLTIKLIDNTVSFGHKEILDLSYT